MTLEVGCDIVWRGRELIEGEERLLTIRFIATPELEGLLTKGRLWWLHEGSVLIGEAEII
ncbi:hypothetical protein GCM10017764_35720 [Sphingobacterium griseoflavum]|uniref:Uncharacterized protein n=1 Tax=Sphingobacterium griseoflavum TaxID=1474952 RepID=A0ABQ3HZL1_9SPHI|nr:hypothetical protein GCM10017764_35720 [Sphingobacterium griseoflavum]